MSENLFEGETVNAPAAAPTAPAAPAPAKGRGRPAGSKNKTAADALEPLVAECKITYGKNKTALPGDFLVPTSDDEREYLLKIEAARELNDAEVALFEKLNG